MNTTEKSKAGSRLHQMKRPAFAFITFLVIISWSCQRVPITGRRQFAFVPESELHAMSVTEYNKFLSTHVVLGTTDSNALMIKRTGTKISEGITTYMKTHGQAKRVAGYNWQFNLVQDNTVNAWCMPGGKVVFYTGILPLTQDENGVSVVMGHEIAHAIARHGNERISQQLAIQMGGLALSVALSQKPEQTQQIFLQAYGVSTTLGALAYSRKHESEADKLGLIFMALAGYDPNHAVPFWQRMASRAGADGPPVFLRTHPSNEQRIKDIKAYIPTAMKYYNKGTNNTRGTSPRISRPGETTTKPSGK
ncbi:MAG TPA: M48 family metallopeptidase [Bacteroidia bacterium]|nr:M48 family metallopeptidase [Bacteroidia bacterium]